MAFDHVSKLSDKKYVTLARIKDVDFHESNFVNEYFTSHVRPIKFEAKIECFGYYPYNTSEERLKVEDYLQRKNLQLHKRLANSYSKEGWMPISEAAFDYTIRETKVRIKKEIEINETVRKNFALAVNLEYEILHSRDEILDFHTPPEEMDVKRDFYLEVEESRIIFHEGGQSLSLNIVDFNGDKYFARPYFNEKTFVRGQSKWEPATPSSKMHPTLRFILGDSRFIDSFQEENYQMFKAFNKELSKETPYPFADSKKPKYECKNYQTQILDFNNLERINYGSSFSVRCNVEGVEESELPCFSFYLVDGKVIGHYEKLVSYEMTPAERESMHKIAKMAMDFDYKAMENKNEKSKQEYEEIDEEALENQGIEVSCNDDIDDEIEPETYLDKEKAAKEAAEQRKMEQETKAMAQFLGKRLLSPRGRR